MEGYILYESKDGITILCDLVFKKKLVVVISELNNNTDKESIWLNNYLRVF